METAEWDHCLKRSYMYKLHVCHTLKDNVFVVPKTAVCDDYCHLFTVDDKKRHLRKELCHLIVSNLPKQASEIICRNLLDLDLHYCTCLTTREIRRRCSIDLFGGSIDAVKPIWRPTHRTTNAAPKCELAPLADLASHVAKSLDAYSLRVDSKNNLIRMISTPSSSNSSMKSRR